MHFGIGWQTVVNGFSAFPGFIGEPLTESFCIMQGNVDNRVLIGLSGACVTPGELGTPDFFSLLTGFEGCQPDSALAIALGFCAISGVGDEGSELTTSDLVRQQDKRADADAIFVFQDAMLRGLIHV